VSENIPPEMIRLAARIAFRQYEQLTSREREAVLLLVINYGDESEGNEAERTLFHLREQRRHQLLLDSILNQAGDGNGNGQGHGEAKAAPESPADQSGKS